MISTKNRPITLFIAAPILGAGMLLGVGHILFTVFGSLFLASSDEWAAFGLAVLSPFLLFYVAQIAVFVLIGYLLLRGIYNWSKTSIILSTIACPVGFLLVVASIAGQFDVVIDIGTPFGLGIYIFIALTPLIMGAVAFNDIRYRLPQISTK